MSINVPGYKGYQSSPGCTDAQCCGTGYNGQESIPTFWQFQSSGIENTWPGLVNGDAVGILQFTAQNICQWLWQATALSTLRWTMAFSNIPGDPTPVIMQAELFNGTLPACGLTKQESFLVQAQPAKLAAAYKFPAASFLCDNPSPLCCVFGSDLWAYPMNCNCGVPDPLPGNPAVTWPPP